MGVVDKAWNRFRCHKCNATDIVTAIESGSSYGASWGEPSKSALFNVMWKRGQFAEPKPTSVTCVACGVAAQVEHSYTNFAKK